MSLEFTLPDVGEGVAEGEIVEWLVSPGEQVAEDQPLVEVETDKAVVEVPSPVDGTVTDIRAEVGDIVPVGDVIIVLQPETGTEDGRSPSATAAATESEPDPEMNGLERTDEESQEPIDTPETTETADTSETTAADDHVFAAPSVRRVARELDVDITTLDGSGPAGRITEQDVRDAATTPPSDESLSVDGHEPEPEPESASTPGPKPGSTTATATESGTESGTGTGTGTGTGVGVVAHAERDRTLAVPATRRIAAELNVDIDAVPATEQRDGKPYVTSKAVREYAQSQEGTQTADATGHTDTMTAGDTTTTGDDATSTGVTTTTSATADRTAPGEEKRIPYRGVRRTIGEQMTESKYTAPHVTHHDQVDVTSLVEARTELQSRAEDRGISLSYLPLVLKAVVAALKEYPILNSRLDEENSEIVQKGYYNIGIATATDAGLMVPVVDDVDHKSLLQLSAEMNELVQKARERSISREEMQGGTFTITNFGAIGGEYATPIINYPETAILGLGAIKERPWVVDGEVRPRHVITLSLSIDHRVIDGAEAAQFTNYLKNYLQNPTLLLLE